jgi:hypothetical protein
MAQNDKLMDHEYSRRLRRRIGQLICFRCRGAISVGSRVHVHRIDHVRNPPGHRLYHQECWEELFIEC